MGEPGFLFWDTIHDWFMLSEYDDVRFAGVNPCAEQPLVVWGSCLLGSMNLSAYIVNAFTDEAYFDYDAFEADAKIATQGMHDVFMEGLQLLPLAKQRETAEKYRQIGLGFMGWADALIKLGVKFGSDESLKYADAIGQIMINAALQQSSEIAKVDGVFPVYDEEKVLHSAFMQENATPETVAMIKENGLAHGQLLTCAPTGTISTMWGISGGLEPIVMYSYDRKTESLHGEDVTYKIYTPIVKEYMKQKDIDREEDLPEFFTNAMKLDSNERIAMQSMWQKHIDASISSTINLPEETTVEQVVDIYLNAWKHNLKGVTIFRSGCRREALLTATTEHFIDIYNDVHEVSSVDKLKWGTTLATSDKWVGLKRKLQTEIGTVNVQAWFDKTSGKVKEIWLIESSGGAYTDLITALGRMLSASLRTGVSLQYIASQMHSISKNDDNSITSLIANALNDMQKEHFVKNGIKEDAPIIKSPTVKVTLKETAAGTCPVCGSPVVFTNGCMNCVSCSYGGCHV